MNDRMKLEDASCRRGGSDMKEDNRICRGWASELANVGSWPRSDLASFESRWWFASEIELMENVIIPSAKWVFH